MLHKSILQKTSKMHLRLNIPKKMIKNIALIFFKNIKDYLCFNYPISHFKFEEADNQMES